MQSKINQTRNSFQIFARLPYFQVPMKCFSLYFMTRPRQHTTNIISFFIRLVQFPHATFALLFYAFYKSDKDKRKKFTLKTDIGILTFFCFYYVSNLSVITRRLCLILRFQLHSSILPLLLIFKPFLIISFGFVSR